MVGDIILVHTQPPHIASVCGEDLAVCEDGTQISLHDVAYDICAEAIEVVKALERSVLGYDKTWRLRDSE